MRRLAAALATILLLAGCSGVPRTSPGTGRSSAPSITPSSSESTSPSASPSPSPSPPAVPPAPPKDACYQLTMAELTRPTNASRPVSCGSKHDTRTIYVGRLDTVVDGHAVAVDSDTVQHQLATTCPRRLDSYLGGSRTARQLARFRVVWFSPTVAQSDAGADWFRCDLIAFSGEQTLLPLPRRSLHGVLNRTRALSTYGLCGTAAPGAAGFSRVICARKHSWRALDTISLAGGSRYPGPAAVRRAGDSACKDKARAAASDTLKFRYGWEWPTRDQWTRGQHYGYCWVPAS